MNAFDSDPMGKFGVSSGMTGLGGTLKKNKGVIDASFGSSYGPINRRVA